MNIIFAGTPEIAAVCLSALLDSSHQVIAVYTQPDRAAGRGKKLTPSPVKLIAQSHNLPIFQPEKLTGLEMPADLMVVVAYGLILPVSVLNAPRLGCINLHTSLLPKYRGAAPMQHAILNGETQTGVSVMQLDKGCDTGPVLLQETCEISETDTTETLLKKLTVLGAKALLQTLDDLEQGRALATPQDHTKTSYAKKIEKLAGCIDWNLSAQAIHRAVRAYQPWPLAHTFIHSDRFNILGASVLDTPSKAAPGTILSVSKAGVYVATGQGQLRLEIIQLSGKKPMAVAALLNGRPQFFQAGMIFHDAP